MAVLLPDRISRGLRPLLPRDPISALQEELDDLVSRFSADLNGEWVPDAMTPSLDLCESADKVVVRADMPGIKAADIKVEVTGNTLRVSGERKEEKAEKGKTFHRVERRNGMFARALTLPCAVQKDKGTAECNDGVLIVTLPKSEVTKTRTVQVLDNRK